MKTLQYLSDPLLAGLFWPGVLVGLAIAITCAALSWLIVLRRLAFIGQGVSHAAFGGLGLASLIASFGLDFANSTGRFPIVLIFCVLAGALISRMSTKRAVGGGWAVDTAIGIVLVASMAGGAVMLHLSHVVLDAQGTSQSLPQIQWEAILFGSITSVGWGDVAVAAGVMVLILIALFWLRRPMLLWAFDPDAADAVGVSSKRMSLTLIVLISLIVVMAMKLAGVVLVTAFLVLPGSIALQLTQSLNTTRIISMLVAIGAVLGGLIVSFELDWPSGASIVLMLITMHLLASVWGWVRQRRPLVRTS